MRDLSPGYFALVMSTGILSTASDQDGAAMLAGVRRPSRSYSSTPT